MDKMDMDKMIKEKGGEETEYIIPYKDNGIRDKIKISLTLLGVVWAFLLLLKIIRQDNEWGIFLIFTALFLLFIVLFFITKAKTSDLKTAVKTKEKTEDPTYTLFYKAEDEEKPTSRISSVPDGPADYVPFTKDKEEKGKPRGKNNPNKSSAVKDATKYNLFSKEKKKMPQKSRSLSNMTRNKYKMVDLPSSSSSDEKVVKRMSRPPVYTLLVKDKKDKPEDEKKSPLEAVKKYEASDYQESFEDKKTNIIIEEDIFIRDEEDEKRTILARLEIEKVPSKNPDEDDKLNIDLDIVVDPDEENPMHVDVQAQVEDKEMEVQTQAGLNEEDGKAEVRAEIQQGDAEDKDKVTLEVVSDDTDSHKMELKATQREGKERSRSDMKNKKSSPSSY